MSELLALGVSHKTAPIALRERLALPDIRAAAFLHELAADASVLEALAVSTCNRTELYLVVSDPVEAESAALSMLARQAGIRPTELVDVIYSLRNCDVARHLFRVTCGLESMIVGENEVQGQVKRAYELALREGTTGVLLNRLFREALLTGKRARTETAISANRVSVASVAVSLARQTLGELAERHVLILGAGETSELTAQALADEGVRTVFVANRRRERAVSLAQRFGGTSVSFDDLPAELGHADIVVASTASPHAIVGRDELAQVMDARPDRPLMLIDIAVPRDIDPECADLDGVSLHDMDDLQAVAARGMSVRRAEASRVEGIVEQEIGRFAQWLGSLEVLPTVAALRARGEEIVEQVLAGNQGRWEEASAADRRRTETIARTVMNRLLHEPTLRLKRGQEDRRSHVRMQVLRELFGLEEEAPALEGERSGADVHELRPRGEHSGG